ncbi:MAG: M48 family metalloprotease [Gemmatimonadales bacterium]
MTDAEAQDLIRRLEARAAENPARYRFRVGALALAGYGYILLMLLVVIGLVVLLGWVMITQRTNALFLKLLIPLLAVLGAILRAFWVKFEAPSGIPVSRTDAPALWGTVDRLSTALAAPRVGRILIDDSFNAAMAQIPRLGILGWHRSYLILGLPLLEGLTTGQVEAVIAHELGHLSANHARFGGWIYRQRRTWGRLLEQLESEKSGLGQVLFTRFFQWYSPYFGAYSFVQARADEYVADRCAAEAAGIDETRSALTRLAAAARLLDQHHWPTLGKQVISLPEPPADLPSRTGAALREETPAEKLRAVVAEAAAEATGLADTHPSLTDRLRGLGWTAPPDPMWAAPPAPGEVALAALLPAALARSIPAQLGAAWQARNRDAWGDQHHKLRKRRQVLEALDAAALAGGLTIEGAWERIGVADEVDPERVPGLVAEFVAAHPEHAEARFVHGRILLRRGDEAGVAELQEAARRDDGFLVGAHQLIAAHLAETGRAEDAAHFERLARERAELIEAAIAERTAVPRDMVLEPAGLDDAQLDRYRRALVPHADAVEVYLARRQVTLMPDKPCYVLAIKPRRRFGRPVVDEPALMRAVSGAADWPQTTYTVALVGGNRWLGPALRKLGALLVAQ